MFNWLKKEPKAVPSIQEARTGFFSTDIFSPRASKGKIMATAEASTFQRTAADFRPIDRAGNTIAMDLDDIGQVKRNYSGFSNTVPEGQLLWYASQGFIGYQTCAMYAQQWLIDKACSMPATDAARNGYEVTINDGTEVSPDIIDYIVQRDREMAVLERCVDQVRSGRIFGIRIAKFIVESTDPDYYLNPFNPDGVKKGSYKGIKQIDPYWITPELDMTSAADPGSLDFYEPTWWRVNGQRIHRSHLIIMRTGTVPDVLKPTYLFGGISIPQKIAERVYAAERTANEAPMLAMSKRLTALTLDVAQALANAEAFNEKMAIWTQFMNNFGVKIIGPNESLQQFDTSLSDLDEVIMTQFQIVSAASDVPATKLLGTQPKGFNSSGDYEAASYREFLETNQTHHMSPLVARHHMLLIRSEVCPKFGVAPFNTEVNWRAVDSPTAEQTADLNLKKAQTDSSLVSTGAIDGVDIRGRLIADRDSGYNGIADTVPGGPGDDKDPDDEETNTP